MGPSSQEGAVKEGKFPHIRKPLAVETGGTSGASEESTIIGV